MPVTTTFHVEGMSCASCVGRVERSLRALPGVEDVAVNLLSEKATVRFAGAPDMAQVAAALTQAGYPLADAETVLNVEGMTCASCVGRVEKALKAVPGVLEASVNLATQTASVRYAEGVVAPSELAARVTAAGYAARPKTEDSGAAVASRRADETLRLRRSFWLALALSLPVVVLAMGPHLVPALHHWLMAGPGGRVSGVVQSVLTLAVLAGPGRVFITHGLPALWRGAPEMNSLVALGALSAFAYSLVATYAPALLPEAARAVYYEAAASIVTLILLGRMLEARAKGRAGEAIARLADLRPRVALVLRDSGAMELPVGEVVRGDLLQLRPGERVAADGLVVTGRSYVDESMLTGEPVPVEKAEGAPLSGGTLNGMGALTYRVTAVGTDTVLAQIMRLVEDAQATKLPVQALVDRITLWFVPAVMALAALSAVVWYLVGPDPALPHALVAGISVLIIACPCAMGLATPVSVLVGSGRAAELGILFRRGDALQKLADVRLVAFDKTGTLTVGHPALTGVQTLNGLSEDRVLALAAAAEAGSEHPLARALLDAASAKGLALPAAEAGQALPGRGYRARVDGVDLLIGNAAALREAGTDPVALEAAAEAAAQQGKTAIFMALDGQAAALFILSDPVRPTAAAAVAALTAAGTRTAMISGDAEATAAAVAAELGIGTVVAGVLPGAKVAALKELAGGQPVAFVGDGINDAPVLAAADVGLAMGGGSDLAREAAEVVIMRNDPAVVASAIALSRATLRNIRQNLFWAFAYNAVLIPVAAGVLYPFNGLLLSPVLASAAMALSSVFVVTNALRLRRFAPVGSARP